MANNVCFLYPQETYHLPTSIWSFEGGQIYRIRSFGVYASRCVSLIQRWNHDGLLDPTTMDDFNTTLGPNWASPKLASQLGAIALNGCWDHQVWPKAWSIRLDPHTICIFKYIYIYTHTTCLKLRAPRWPMGRPFILEVKHVILNQNLRSTSHKDMTPCTLACPKSRFPNPQRCPKTILPLAILLGIKHNQFNLHKYKCVTVVLCICDVYSCMHTYM